MSMFGTDFFSNLTQQPEGGGFSKLQILAAMLQDVGANIDGKPGGNLMRMAPYMQQLQEQQRQKKDYAAATKAVFGTEQINPVNVTPMHPGLAALGANGEGGTPNPRGMIGMGPDLGGPDFLPARSLDSTPPGLKSTSVNYLPDQSRGGGGNSLPPPTSDMNRGGFDQNGPYAGGPLSDSQWSELSRTANAGPATSFKGGLMGSLPNGENMAKLAPLFAGLNPVQGMPLLLNAAVGATQSPDPIFQDGFEYNRKTGQWAEVPGFFDAKQRAAAAGRGPESDIGKIEADYRGGRINREQYDLKLRELRATITDKERGPQRAPVGVVNIRMPNGSTQAFRQDSPGLDAAIKAGGIEAGTDSLNPNLSRDFVLPLMLKLQKGIPLTPPERNALDEYKRLNPFDVMARDAMGGYGAGAAPPPITPPSAPPLSYTAPPAPPPRPPAAAAGAAAGGNGPRQAKRITTEAEYNALPRGSYFIDPDDGKTYQKP
jgi:hypothetical protein